MKEFTADEAQRDFGRVMAETGRAPVRVVLGDEAVVVLSAEEFARYEAMRQRKARDELLALIDQAGAHAAAQGLTDEVLAELLADES